MTNLASPYSCIDNVCQGLTVTTDEAGKVIVARIIIDSFIERQGLLRPGDLILEANGERVSFIFWGRFSSLRRSGSQSGAAAGGD